MKGLMGRVGEEEKTQEEGKEKEGDGREKASYKIGLLKVGMSRDRGLTW